MGDMRNIDYILSWISFSHPSCMCRIISSELYVCSPGMPPMASIAAPLSGVPPLPLPPLPVGVSPPLVSSAPPPLPQPIANGAPPTGMMQPISGFSHPGDNAGEVGVFRNVLSFYLHIIFTLQRARCCFLYESGTQSSSSLLWNEVRTF